MDLTAWNQKPSLRLIYTDWFNEIGRWLVRGRTVEVGCGIGRMKAHFKDITTIDITKSRWTDVVGNGECLPLKSNSIANLVLFDVLHHLPHPVLFFREALRVLKSCGRIILVEPYISLASRIVYDKFHQEEMNLHCNPFDEDVPLSSVRPLDSNQAIATVLFYRKFQTWKQRFSEFAVLHRKRCGLLAYPLTGGFSGKALLPHKIISWLHRKEEALGFLSRLLAFRSLVVLEKG